MTENKQRKTVFRFKTVSDIHLLEEIIHVQPFAADFGKNAERWEDVAARMCKIYGEHTILAATCRTRFNDLISNFKRDTITSLRASGTDEEYEKREQLLQDIVEMVDVVATRKNEAKFDKYAKIKKRELERKSIRNEALISMKRKQNATEDESGQDDSSSEESIPQKVARTSRRLSTSETALQNYVEIMREANRLNERKLEMKHEERQQQLELEKSRWALEQEERRKLIDLMSNTMQLVAECMQKFN
ncbi:hypothetical protein AC1031_010945 [Aphanomyces cochlioides]|nr:hypothetical protein AC1031_010945 [Aphanomyces cochlioides]